MTTKTTKAPWGQGSCYFGGPAPYGQRVEEIAEYLFYTMPLEEFVSAYVDVEDYHLPLASIKRRGYRNLRREVNSWSEEKQAAMWEDIWS